MPLYLLSMRMANPNTHIVFFDGVCGLCNRFVDYLLKHDKQHHLKFAPLQGEAAHEYLSEEDIEAFDSIQYYSDGKVYNKSTAALRIFIKLGGWYKFLGYTGYVFPRFIRDWIYDIVANNRYKWFGKRDQCRIPSSGEKKRFLD